MSRLKLLLPGGKSITLSNPFKTSFKKTNGLSSIVNVASLVLISLFALLLPVSSTLLSTDSETSTLKFLIIFVIGFLLVLVAKLLIQGNSFIIDPKGLLLILIFNLVLTTSSIMITTLRVSNTFGTTGFRYVSGLALMSLIGLFYFANLYALNNPTLKKFLTYFTAGSVLYVVWYLLSGNQTSSQLISNLPLLTIGFGLFVYFVLNQKSKIKTSFALFVFLLLIIISVPFNTVTYLPLFIFTTTLLAAYTLVLVLYTLKKKKDVKSRFLQIKTNIINFINVKKISVSTDKGLADLHLLALYVLPIVLLLCSIFFFVNIPQSKRFTLVTDIYTNYKEGARLITGGTYSIDSNNLRSVIMGVGSDNYDTSKPFLANILIISGIVGVIIYIALWLYFVKNAKDIFLKNLREKKDYKLTGLILLSTLFIPFLFITTSSNLLTVVILWVMYSLVSVFQSKTQINYLDSSISSKNQTRAVRLGKLVVGVILFLAVGYTLNLIIAVLK